MMQSYLKFAVLGLLATGLALAGTATIHAQDSVDEELSQAISKLNPEQKDALLVLLNSIVNAEAALESPEDGAMKAVTAYVKAAEAADLEAIMEQISENFSHYEVGGKNGYRAFLEQVKNDGMLEDITGNIEEAKAEVDGETVKIYPVELEGLFGTATIQFDLKKEGDSWKIVGLDMTGV